MADASSPLQALLERGVASGVFPWGRAVVRVDGKVLFEGGAGGAPPETLFDLASLTKVLGTTAVFLTLWAEGRVDPANSVGTLQPGMASSLPGASLEDLLRHRTGLPAFVPYFAEVLRSTPGLLDSACPATVRARVREQVAARILATRRVDPPGQRAVYSDVGFAMLGEILAAVAGQPLDGLVASRVAGPLGLGIHFRRPETPERTPAAPAGPIAPTGLTRPREPAPGQEGLWPPLPTAPSVAGEVDDDNAWVLDGVAGHAGLFGTAGDVADFGQAVLDDVAGGRRLAPAHLWYRALERDSRTPGSTRGLGFDTRQPGDSPGTSPAGRLGEAGAGAVGHVGFTGVSLWIDVERRLVVALCTNRVALGRGETRIREFRPRFHDAVVEALES